MQGLSPALSTTARRITQAPYQAIRSTVPALLFSSLHFSVSLDINDTIELYLLPLEPLYTMHLPLTVYEHSSSRASAHELRCNADFDVRFDGYEASIDGFFRMLGTRSSRDLEVPF